MQLVALVHSLDHVCCRYRLAAFRAALAQAGHSLELLPIPRYWWQRWALYRELRGASVIVQRFLLPAWELAMLRWSARHLIFDFDDAVWLRDSFSPKGLYHPGRLRRFAAVLRASDAVLAGNHFLAGHAARWTDARRIHLVPTCIDPSRYEPKGAPGDGNELVWIGTTSTLRGIERAAALMEAVGQANLGIRLKVICSRFPTFEHLPVLACPWRHETETRELARADIGISWAPDDAWSRGKCGLKVLQYMAAGLPVVANPIGMHTDLVRHGETGYLASTPQQWQEAIARLRGDAGLRRRMGQAGRWLFESRFTIDAGIQGWEDVLGRLEAASAKPQAAERDGDTERRETASVIDAAGLRWEFAPGTGVSDDVTVLIGPEGLRLEEWLASGQAKIVKHAPHRTVYRVVLPGLDFHLKHYRGDRHEWLRALLRPSKGRAEHAITREVARRGVPTLEALACGEHASRRTGGSLDSFVITRTLPDAVSLVDYLEQVLPTLPQPQSTRLRRRLAVALGTFLARKHRAGLRHDDLHPLNLMVRVNAEGSFELYLIDLHGVRPSRPLSWQSSLENLVILNRWFLIRSNRSDRRRAWRAYCKERDDLSLQERPLARTVEKETRKSFVAFARTLDRRCLGGNRRFRKLRQGEAHGYAVAEIDDAVLAPLLAAPDDLFDRPDSAHGIRVLKKSASSAVVEMTLCVDGRPRQVIFKRFSVTAWSDPLAALVRPTAAMRSWVLGHGLRFRGLPTPRPLAMWHRRRMGLPGEAYLLMEKVPDARDLASVIRSLDALPAAERKSLRWLIRDVASLLRMMHERKISHRDLKAANLLVSPADWTLGYRGVSEVSSLGDPRERVWLVDLVGVRRHEVLERARKVQNLARLNVSFIVTDGLSRSDRLRFLRDYLGFGLFGREGWKRWWKEIEEATWVKVERNRKVGRVLG